MIELRESTGLEVGDKIAGKFPPPLTWLDRFLWRVFRIERKREPVEQEYTVISTNTWDGDR